MNKYTKFIHKTKAQTEIMKRYNTSRIALMCVISLLLIFIFVNQNVELKPDTAQIHESETTFVQETTTVDLPKTSHETMEKKPRSNVEKFFVFSPKCKIPYVDPYASEIVDSANRVPPMVCTADSDLYSVLYDRKKRHYILHRNQDIMRKQYPSITDMHCEYRETVAGKTDSFAMTYGPKPLLEEFIVPRHFLGVVLECKDNKNLSEVVYSDAFSFVQYPDNRNETNDDWRGTHYPSVILFGIDSMSRMNFHRTMPLTSKFTRQQGWYEMEGYNKVGDNTLPNLLAVLTGRSSNEWSRICNLKNRGCFDVVTYLWDYFRNAGYLTAYAEDLPSISTFNYLKSGFMRKPVDFYLRPFMLILENFLHTVEWLGQNYCLGRRTSSSYILDYAKQMIQRFVQESPKPLFGLFWTSSSTHDHPRGGELLDEIFVKYLEEFEEYGLFDKAIVILFSDHGSRYGESAIHPSGFLEERLPMLHIYLPPWYRRRYPEVARALQLNRNRLTSSFDLHMGIRSILEQIRPGIEFVSSVKCLKCQSLFQVVPKNRGCNDANIPYHWCACDTYVPVSTTGITKQLAGMIVYRMNKYLAQLNLDTDCHRLYLDKLIRAKRQLHFNDVGVEIGPRDGMETFQLQFITIPNNGNFRSIVHSDETATYVGIELEEISRLNSYRNESYCVEDVLAKKICVCRKQGEGSSLTDDEINKERKVKYAWLEEHEDEYDDYNNIQPISELKFD